MRAMLEIERIDLSDIVTTSGEESCAENCNLECGGELE